MTGICTFKFLKGDDIQSQLTSYPLMRINTIVSKQRRCLLSQLRHVIKIIPGHDTMLDVLIP